MQGARLRTHPFPANGTVDTSRITTEIPRSRRDRARRVFVGPSRPLDEPAVGDGVE
jgi:hypothetical protein